MYLIGTKFPIGTTLSKIFIGYETLVSLFYTQTKVSYPNGFQVFQNDWLSVGSFYKKYSTLAICLFDKIFRN